jgi:hypothetical protein
MSDTLNKYLDFSDVLKGLSDSITNILTSGMNDEEKLNAVLDKMANQVQDLRVKARKAGAEMRALSDPDTAALEPLEAAQERRRKLVALGGKHMDDPVRQGQIAQEIEGLQSALNSLEGSYEIRKQTYEVALANYQKALQAYESMRNNGPAMMAAIQAHTDALESRETLTQGGDQIDTSIMDTLAAKLQGVQAELRSDEELTEDLDASNSGSIDAELAQMDAQEVSSDLMEEFRAASQSN